MSTTVIAHINASQPLGRKVVCEIENKRTVKTEYPLPLEIAGKQWHTVDEVFAMVEKKINDRYGTNYKI